MLREAPNGRVDPFGALYVYFVEPFTEDWSREDLVVKAVPIILGGDHTITWPDVTGSP